MADSTEPKPNKKATRKKKTEAEKIIDKEAKKEIAAPKKSKRDGTKNLTPVTKRTKEEAKKISAKGGVKSGVTRRRQKAFREVINAMLLDPSTINPNSTKLEDIVAVTLERALAGDRNARDFLFNAGGLKTLEAQKATKYIKDFQKGKATLEETALKFDAANLPLPEGITIMLARAEPKAEDPSAGQYSVFSDDEMEAKLAERQAEIDAQAAGLSDRRQAMDDLHKEYSDHFKPENTPTATTEKNS